MNPILAVVLTSLLVGGAACSGARASGESSKSPAVARHAAQGDSPWLEDAPSRSAAGDEAPAAASSDASESSDDGDALGDEGSDDFGDEGGGDAGGEDSETTIDFGEEEWGGEEDWEVEEDQGNG
jgi:hypothetical protein